MHKAVRAALAVAVGVSVCYGMLTMFGWEASIPAWLLATGATYYIMKGE